MALAIRVFPAPVAACSMIRRTPRIGRSQDRLAFGGARNFEAGVDGVGEVAGIAQHVPGRHASRPRVKFGIRKNDAALVPREIFGETDRRRPGRLVPLQLGEPIGHLATLGLPPSPRSCMGTPPIFLWGGGAHQHAPPWSFLTAEGKVWRAAAYLEMP